MDASTTFVQELEAAGTIRAVWKSGTQNLADVLTKALDKKRFDELSERLGVTRNDV